MTLYSRAPPVEGTFTIHNFTFESGATLESLTIGYVMYGTLNAARDNLCIVMPGKSNLRHGTAEHVDPGRATRRTGIVSCALTLSGVALHPSLQMACTTNFLATPFVTW